MKVRQTRGIFPQHASHEEKCHGKNSQVIDVSFRRKPYCPEMQLSDQLRTGYRIVRSRASTSSNLSSPATRLLFLIQSFYHGFVWFRLRYYQSRVSRRTDALGRSLSFAMLWYPAPYHVRALNAGGNNVSRVTWREIVGCNRIPPA